MRKNLSKKSEFYVYIYLNPLKPGNYSYENGFSFNCEPFYIGKGKGRRLFNHLKSNNLIVNSKANKHKINTIKKILNSQISKKEFKENFIIKIQENLQEFCAFGLEEYLIRLIGRADLKLGPLTNMTDGGDGDSGRKSKLKGVSLVSFYGEETANLKIEKQINSYKKNYKKENHPLFGKHHSEETKKKIGNRYYPTGKDNPLYGKKKSLEQIEKCKKTKERNGIKVGKDHPSYIPIPEELRLKIIELYKKENSLLAVSKMLDMGVSKIKSILEEEKIYKRKITYKDDYVDEIIISQILSLFREGKNMKEIQIQLSLKRLTVKKILLKNGMHTRNKFLNVSKEDIEKIIDLYQNTKLGIYVIRKEFNKKYSIEIIKNVLKNNNIKLRGRDGPRKRRKKCGKYIFINKLTQEKMIDLYINKYCSPSEISLILGYNINKIRRTLKENNVVFRKRSESQKARYVEKPILFLEKK